MSSTPRTDEFYYERNRRPSDAAWLKYARTLERELAEAQGHAQDAADADGRITAIVLENDRLKSEAVRWGAVCKASQDQVVKVIAENGGLRTSLKEAVTLVRHMRECLDYVNTPGSLFGRVDRFLKKHEKKK